MSERQRVVLDTNTLVSGTLLVASLPGLAVRKAIMEDCLLMSEASLYELADVLSRKKFDHYVTVEEREEFVRLVYQIADVVPTMAAIHDCPDETDNRILEVTVNGRADLIVSGDRDLLQMNPFRGIPIVTPADYVKRNA